MKDVGTSDFWDIVVEHYCTKEEMRLLQLLKEDEYDELAEEFENAVVILRDKLKKMGA